MYIRSRNNNTAAIRKYWLAVTLVVTVTISIYLVFPGSIDAESNAKTEPYSFKSTKGLRLKVLKSDHISFIHAQLIIYYSEQVKNPAIPYLTLLNIFERNLKGTDSNLLSILKKLGNDYQVEHRPDFLLFKINFLPDKMQLFIRFLKALYSYKPFGDLNSPTGSYVDEKRKLNTKVRFKDSIANFWNYFYKKKDWKILVAYQIAYNHWFPLSVMGKTLITPASLKDVILERLRSFYERTYKLSNSMLIIKGNIENPPILHGHIERIFGSFKKQLPRDPLEEKLNINPRKKIFVFNTNDDDTPAIFLLEAIPTSKGRNPVLALVLNNILFSYPTGRVYISSRLYDINSLRMQTQMVNHRGLTVICNTIRLRYSDIGKFILLVDKEWKKLRVMEVEKREFLNTLSNIYGRLKVNTQDFEHDVNLEIIKAEYYPEKVTLASLNQTTDDSKNEIIVIVGNAKLILPHLGLFKPRVEVIDFTR